MDSNLRDTYNRIAEDWHKDHQQDSWWVDGTNKFIELVGPGAHVLDVGCGGGFKSRYLADRGLQVTGIDFAENMVAIAKREVPEATFKVLDMYQASTLGEMFDGIFIQAALLHIPKKDVPGVLQGLVQKLKPGGYVYIAVKGKREGGVDEEVVSERDYGYDYQRFFSYFTPAELEAYLQGLGLALVRSGTEQVQSNWVQVIAKK